jgi:predicted NBD/HSP70 family sugar kinase
MILEGIVADPRGWLIEALAASMTDEQARKVVDALDAYLAEGPDRAVTMFEDRTPNYRGELEKALAERDAAIDAAKHTVQKMQELLESLSGKKE